MRRLESEINSVGIKEAKSRDQDSLIKEMGHNLKPTAKMNMRRVESEAISCGIDYSRE
jgi:hypothetical protein